MSALPDEQLAGAELFDHKATNREELVCSRTAEFVAIEQRIAHGLAEPGDAEAFAEYRDAEKRILGGALGDIEDPDYFARRALNDVLRARGAHLRPAQYEDAVGYLLLVLVYLYKKKYDPTRSSLKFSQYANPILHNRVTDYYRKLLGDSRYGMAPDEISWDDVDEHEQPTEPSRLTLDRLLADVNLSALTPDARRTIDYILKPIVARGATLDEIAAELGWNRRRVSTLLADLREQVERQNKERAA